MKPNVPVARIRKRSCNSHDLTGIDKTMKHRNEKGGYVDGKEFNRSSANGQNTGGPQVMSEMAGSPIRMGKATGKPKGRSEFCTPLTKVALLGNYIPRRCGLATFTADLHAGMATRYPQLQCPVVAVNDANQWVMITRTKFNLKSSNRTFAHIAARQISSTLPTRMLCVQHEFGIFGGSAGSHVLALLREVRMPIVTTLHTILRNPTREQRRTFEEVLRLSHRLVVMSKKAAGFLREISHVTGGKSGSDSSWNSGHSLGRFQRT